jgi:hypothetical protein
MAVPELPSTLQELGAEYHSQLIKLGLRPEAFLWMHKPDEDEFVLSIVWSGVDRFGPFEVNKRLFEAYRKAVLTRAIDPFIVELRSPKEVFGATIREHMSEGGEHLFYRILETNSLTGEQKTTHQWRSEWAYSMADRKRSHMEVKRDWDRFKRNVAAAA